MTVAVTASPATMGARYGQPIESITPVKHPIAENFVNIFTPLLFNIPFNHPSSFLSPFPSRLFNNDFIFTKNSFVLTKNPNISMYMFLITNNPKRAPYVDPCSVPRVSIFRFNFSMDSYAFPNCPRLFVFSLKLSIVVELTNSSTSSVSFVSCSM